MNHLMYLDTRKAGCLPASFAWGHKQRTTFSLDSSRPTFTFSSFSRFIADSVCLQAGSMRDFFQLQSTFKPKFFQNASFHACETNTFIVSSL